CPRDVSGERPRVGVALSGGAAKGLAHIGVLKVLEDTGIPVDYITGVSMGSIIGGLYAVGYTTAELESLALHVDWDKLFSDRIPRSQLGMEYKIWDSRYQVTLPIRGASVRLPSGLIDGQNLNELLSRLAVPLQRKKDFRRFPIPFTCVATDIEKGEAVVLNSGFLARAIRASAAIPSVFTAVRIDDRLLVDGGLVRDLPARDVIDLGADIVIVVDVVERKLSKQNMNSIVSMTRLSLAILLKPQKEEQRALCNIVVTPDMDGIRPYDFGKARRLITIGEEAARGVMPQLERLADSLSRWGPIAPPKRPPPVNSFYINEIEVRGAPGAGTRIIRREFGLEVPGRMTVEEIEHGVERVYNTQSFRSVTYGIEPAGAGLKLVLDVVEGTNHLFRAGIRYDSRRKGGLLLNATFRNLTKYRATFALDLDLEEQYRIDAKFFMHTGLLRVLGYRLRANTSRVNLSVYEREQRVAQYIDRYTFAEALLGTIYSTMANVGVGIRAERNNQELATGPPGYADTTNVLVPFFGEIVVDTYNRTVFPTRGLFVRLSAEVADRGIGSDASFTRFYADERLVLALHPRLSLLQNVFVGASNGSVPPSYLFYLGGVEDPIALQAGNSTFFGLDYQERAGPTVQMILLGLQFEVARRLFLQAGWTMGNTFAEWNTKLSSDRYINGAGVSAGYGSVIG
ncbi:MAG: patatin-like phospholipase family protein, partial [bacterium]